MTTPISRNILGGVIDDEKVITITASVATCEAVDYQGSAGGEIYVPAGSSLTTLTFHVARKPEGTFHAAYDGEAPPAAVTLTVAAEQAYPIPDAIFGAGAFKMVGNTTGSVTVTLKG